MKTVIKRQYRYNWVTGKWEEVFTFVLRKTYLPVPIHSCNIEGIIYGGKNCV